MSSNSKISEDDILNLIKDKSDYSNKRIETYLNRLESSGKLKEINLCDLSVNAYIRGNMPAVAIINLCIKDNGIIYTKDYFVLMFTHATYEYNTYR